MSTRRRREFFTGVSFLAVAVALGAVATMLDHRAAAQGKAAVQAPMFEVDPLWPKPLPKNWTLGNAIGIAVDSNDQVWMIHRTSGVNDNFKTPGASCCTVAPPILGFNQAGDVIGSWGGPGAGVYVARLEPRALDRLQRELLDCWQWRQGHTSAEVHVDGEVPASNRDAWRP